MPQVEITNESSVDSGWLFDAQLLDEDGRLLRLSLRLSWADYNLWSRTGSDPPHAVALAVLAYLLERKPPTELPARLDASMARRWYPDADEYIPRYILAED